MRSIAIDIGTTKLCAVAVDEDSGEVLEAINRDNAFIGGGKSFERVQDPGKIFQAVSDMTAPLIQKHGPVRCIGISAQQHGILYVDAGGRLLSPLCTWQDGRAAEPYQGGKTYAEYLSAFSTSPIAPGYGLATHFYNVRNGRVPADAQKLCTIGDYAAMRLTSSAAPLIHRTNAAGLGFFSANKFESAALEKAGIESGALPRLAAEYEVIGQTPEGIPVCAALGDNQASFLGSVRDSAASVLVNIGTGSQISLAIDAHNAAKLNAGVERRPFFDGKELLVGASLCGGRAYAILEKFFREVLRMAGKDADSPFYPYMDALAHDSLETGDLDYDPLKISTLFAGTRQDPSLRGSILSISENNFTPGTMITGFLRGMTDELIGITGGKSSFTGRNCLVGSGNGIRRNEPLKRLLPEKFGMPLSIPLYKEEAAYGAALYALACTGKFKNAAEAQKIVRYEEQERKRR
jgi:sedoheptulokinase